MKFLNIKKGKPPLEKGLRSTGLEQGVWGAGGAPREEAGKVGRARPARS